MLRITPGVSRIFPRGLLNMAALRLRRHVVLASIALLAVLSTTTVAVAWAINNADAWVNTMPPTTSTVSHGVFWVRVCDTEKMAPGYTLTFPLEDHTVYWFKHCRVVHTMDMPGRVGLAKQMDGNVRALVGSSLLGFAPDGARQFAIYKGALPGPAHHDFVRTENGTYITLTKVKLEPGIFDDVIIEVDTSGKILWRWSVNEHLLGSRDGTRNREGEKWIHSNSLDLFPDGDILLSARNLNEVVRIDRTTGEVVWRRGSDVLSLAHHATVQDDGSILVYNNGVEDRSTSIVKFSPDGDVVMNQSLGFYAEAFGSVQELSNGNWLVVDGPGARVLEYTPDFSELVFEARLLRPNFIPYSDAPVERLLYRAKRIESLPRR